MGGFSVEGSIWACRPLEAAAQASAKYRANPILHLSLYQQVHPNVTAMRRYECVELDEQVREARLEMRVEEEEVVHPVVEHQIHPTGRVQGAGFRVQGSGNRVQGAGFRVQGSGCMVQGAGFRVERLGFRV